MPHGLAITPDGSMVLFEAVWATATPAVVLRGDSQEAPPGWFRDRPGLGDKHRNQSDLVEGWRCQPAQHRDYPGR
jgi:hypothetical protein